MEAQELVTMDIFNTVVGGLCVAVVALAGYVVTNTAKDKADRNEAHHEMMSVVKQNSEAFARLSEVVKENTKVTEAMQRMVVEYLRAEH